MYSLERNIIFNKDSERVEMINRARQRIREALESPLSIQQIASEMSVSYSNFRKLFKEYTGISPALYQQDLEAAARQGTAFHHRYEYQGNSLSAQL